MAHHRLKHVNRSYFRIADRPELTDHCEPWLSRSHVIARAPQAT
jgi:hypothetical protein